MTSSKLPRLGKRIHAALLALCQVPRTSLMEVVRRSKIKALSFEKLEITDDELSQLVATGLTSLTLSNCRELTPAAGKSLAKMVTLTELDIWGSKVFPEGDWSFLRNLTALRKLRLGSGPGQNVVQVDDASLRRLLQNRKLLDLELRFVDEISRETMTAIAGSSLERVSFLDSSVFPDVLEDLCNQSAARIVMPDGTVREGLSP